MNASKALMELLKGYDVSHVFGLPGETTLNWYREWHDYPEIRHVLARDERSAVFMADGYAKTSFRPGICEGPSVGATHMLPGVAEAYKASVPMVVFTSDIPLHLEKRNMLTGVEQTALFQGVTKETITVTDASELPNTVRRAFRLSTTGRPGPVHIRLPMDVLGDEIDAPQLHMQRDFSKYPGHRPIAQGDKLLQAVKMLSTAERPVIVCGQGVLYSQAWNEVQTLAEIYGVPVGTTISGKGSMPELHPLSIGVTGARGGTTLSNRVVNEADVVFYIGCNTDSASTDKWTIPGTDTEAKIIHLDISEAEVGNAYPTEVALIGDAKATLGKMIEATTIKARDLEELPRLRAIREEAAEYGAYVEDLSRSEEEPVHPLRFIRELTHAVPDGHVLVVDVGVSAIYTSTFYKVSKAGRSVLYNYAMGALGYAIPASVGARFARPDSCLVTLVGDGSFGFTAAELETVSRVGGNNNIILFNNGSYGWIKAAISFSQGHEYADFSTNFKEVDYPKIAEGFGLKAYLVEGPEELGHTLKEAFGLDEPTFIELRVMPENVLVPPVPSWIRKAEDLGIRHVW
ncbi:MAG: thiamine pyrophosphate-binding protein [Candidatus Bathyarchaeota archaeon]|nr:MAG: thiamine pyrophosphate-binding protein [Candidatus Bathyarchaeota archaeon]